MNVLPASLTATFCSDIRREEGGFKTMVGIYTQVFRVQLPHTFPKLLVSVLGHFNFETAPKKFDFKLLLDGEELFDHPAPSEFMDGLVDSALRGGHPFASLQTSAGVEGLEVEEDCEFTVVAIVDDQEYLIGRLLVRGQEADEE
jgi:hypothetical protein